MHPLSICLLSYCSFSLDACTFGLFFVFGLFCFCDFFINAFSGYCIIAIFVTFVVNFLDLLCTVYLSLSKDYSIFLRQFNFNLQFILSKNCRTLFLDLPIFPFLYYPSVFGEYASTSWGQPDTNQRAWADLGRWGHTG